jgi:endonuclease-3
VLEVERKLDKWVPKKHKKDAHHLLILHGRYTCIARKPRCQSCVIEDLCEYENKTGHQDDYTATATSPII